MHVARHGKQSRPSVTAHTAALFRRAPSPYYAGGMFSSERNVWFVHKVRFDRPPSLKGDKRRSDAELLAP